MFNHEKFQGTSLFWNDSPLTIFVSGSIKHCIQRCWTEMIGSVPFFCWLAELILWLNATVLFRYQTLFMGHLYILHGGFIQPSWGRIYTSFMHSLKSFQLERIVYEQFYIFGVSWVVAVVIILVLLVIVQVVSKFQECCNHSKIWTVWLYHRVMSPNNADGMANSVDPDLEQSDLGLHCLPRHICPKT